MQCSPVSRQGVQIKGSSRTVYTVQSIQCVYINKFAKYMLYKETLLYTVINLILLIAAQDESKVIGLNFSFKSKKENLVLVLLHCTFLPYQTPEPALLVRKFRILSN